MSKFTPGPWHAFPCRHSGSEKEVPYLWQIRDAKHDIVATTAQYGVHTGAPLGREERAANAALLTAAPELLAALESALWEVTQFEKRTGVPQLLAWAATARRVIAKAKGEEA